MFAHRSGARYLVSPNVEPRPIFDLPFNGTQVPAFSIGSATATYSRASTAYVFGYTPTAVLGVDSPIHILCASGEARFHGFRRISQGVWSNTDANGLALTTGNGAASTCCDVKGPFGYVKGLYKTAPVEP